MSEIPQEAREDEREDLLERIISQGLNKVSDPAQAATAEESQAEKSTSDAKQKDQREADAPQVNRRSSVYLYLLILFGAAFLMLLLAYFVQQRSNENTISDLRETMSLSREQLLAEIRELEDQNTALENKNDELQGALDNWESVYRSLEEQYKKKDQEVSDLWNQILDAQDELSAWSHFWWLEYYYLAEDYESCAALLVMESMRDFSSIPSDESAYERHEEIVRTVIDMGILDEDYLDHIPDYGDLLDAFFNKRGMIIDSAQWAE